MDTKKEIASVWVERTEGLDGWNTEHNDADTHIPGARSDIRFPP